MMKCSRMENDIRESKPTKKAFSRKMCKGANIVVAFEIPV